jgi:multidrug efflux pump
MVILKYFFGGDNVAFFGPLSWTMIFGLLFATVLTLLLIPVNVFNYRKIKT